MLHQPKNRVIIQRVVDDTSTLRASRNGSVSNSQAPPTIISHSNSTIDARSFAMDPVIVNTPAYQRVQEYRRDIGYNKPRPGVGVRPMLEEDREWDDRSASRTEHSGDWPAPTSPFTNRAPQSRLLQDVTVASEPIDIFRSRQLGSGPHNIDSMSLPARNPAISSLAGHSLQKKASWLRFGRKTKSENTITKHNSASVSPTPESRRGRRGFEDNAYQSIDFSLPDSLSVPAIVRAAQAGSVVEVEQLLDRGTDIDARHESTGKNALAVAAHCGNAEVVNLLLQYGAKGGQRDASGSTPLNLAASRGHVVVLGLLLRDGAAVEERDAEQRTALWLACRNGHLEAARLLLDHKAKVNARAQDQLTALHIAAKGGDAAMINLLLAHGAHVDAKDGQFMGALHHACRGGHESAINVLLSKRADIEARGKAFQTPLITAASAGHLHIVELLLKRKASFKHKADKGMNALHWASRNGHVEIVDFLISKKLPLNAPNADGNTPLHFAIIHKRFDVVELLLRKKAELEIRCQRSYTALHYGCAAENPEIVEMLLRYNAEFEAPTADYSRPLHIAITHGTLRTVQLLLSWGANYEVRNKAEDRALCLACYHGNVAITEALLNAGAPLRSKFSNKPRSHEDSPLCVAARQGHLEICSLLISRGASIRQKDELLWQPLRYAAHYGHPEIVQLLLSHGAKISSTGPSGGWGFDVTASRIGFALNVEISQQRKDVVLALLQNAEERENVAKEREANACSVLFSPNEKQSSPSELIGSSNSTAQIPPRYPQEDIHTALGSSPHILPSTNATTIARDAELSLGNPNRQVESPPRPAPMSGDNKEDEIYNLSTAPVELRADQSPKLPSTSDISPITSTLMPLSAIDYTGSAISE